MMEESDSIRVCADCFNKLINLAAVATLALRVRKQRLALPLGLLQLRPLPATPASAGSKPHQPSVGPHDGSLAATAADSPTPTSRDSSGVADQPAAAADASATSTVDGDASGSSNRSGSSSVEYRNAASEGLDAFSDPQYPALRRMQRLSYAAAISLMDMTPSEGRQAVLEANSVGARLRLVLASLIKHRKVLSAIAAVRGLSPQDPPGED